MSIQARSIISTVRIPAHVSILKTLLYEIAQRQLTDEENDQGYFLQAWSPQWGVTWGCILNAVLEDLDLPWEVSRIQQVIDAESLVTKDYPIIQRTSAVVRRRDINIGAVGVDVYIRTYYEDAISALIQAYNEQRLSFGR